MFLLKENKAIEEKVMGVCALFEEDYKSWSDKKVPKFREFRYYFEIKSSIAQYNWIKGSDVFASKEELIASL